MKKPILNKYILYTVLVLGYVLPIKLNATIIDTKKSGKWSDITVWNSLKLPAYGDTIRINAGDSVYLDVTNPSINSLLLYSGSILNSGKDTLTINGTLDNNGGALQFQNGTLIFNGLAVIQAGNNHIIGNLFIGAQSVLLSKTRRLFISGNWSAYGSFSPNSNTVIFTGGLDQQIIGYSQSQHDFFNLIVDKTSGSITNNGSYQSIVIQNNVTFNSNSLILNNGADLKISNPDPAALIFKPGAGMQGKINRAVFPSGTYDFPITYNFSKISKKALEYCSISLSQINGIKALIVDFSPSAGAAPALSKYCVPVNDQLNGGYWSVTPVGTPQSGTFDIKLTDQGHTNGTTFDNGYIVINRFQPSTAALSPWMLNGRHSPSKKDSSGIGSAVCQGLSYKNFGEFNIGKSNSPIPMGALSANFSKTDAICNMGTVGTATAFPVNGTAPYTYVWKTNPVQNTQTGINLPTGKDSVNITDAYGCKYFTTIDIYYKSPPSSRFFATAVTGNTVNFTVGAVEKNTAYSWDFGDNITALGTTNTHTYSSSGGYLVTLKVMDSSVVYCQNSTSMYVTVGKGGCTTNSEFNFIQDTTTKAFSFYNYSSGNNLKSFWDFGNGTSSFNTNPSKYNYSTGGAYTVCLTIRDTLQNCQSTTCHDLKVNRSTDCSTKFYFFTDNSANTVQFDGHSVNTAGRYSWTFGNGDYSNDANPLYTYKSSGYYEVCLTTQDSIIAGCQSKHCEKIHVGKGDCSAGFSVLPTVNTLKASFQDASSGTIAAWHWDFGDGNISNIKNPVYTYAKPGFYEVCLSDSGTSGCQSKFCKTITAGTGDCKAVFSTFTAASGLFAAFKDQSLGSPTAWSWEYGDGQHSTVQSPVHTYVKSGIYSVCLNTLSANNCVSEYCEDITMGAIGSDCQADFDYFEKNKIADFRNKSLGTATSYFWDFGDQGTSNLKAPKHTFASDGYYKVTLTVYDVITNCFNTSFKNITIGTQAAAMDCEAKFSYIADTVTKIVRFKDGSFGNPVSWAWVFRDSLFTMTSNLQNPTIVFPQNGFYHVCLTIKSANGSSSIACSEIGIGRTGLYADFTYAQNGKYAFKNTATYPVYFYGSAYGKPSKWKWDFGDNGVDSLRIDVTHNYLLPGSYNACLAVSDPNTQLSNNHCKSVKVSEVQGLRDISGSNVSLGVYPNPMAGHGIVTYFLETNTQIQLSLFDLYGKRLKTLAVAEQQGFVNQAIDISDLGLAQGMYLIQLSVNGKLLYKPVVVSK